MDTKCCRAEDVVPRPVDEGRDFDVLESGTDLPEILVIVDQCAATAQTLEDIADHPVQGRPQPPREPARCDTAAHHVRGRWQPFTQGHREHPEGHEEGLRPTCFHEISGNIAHRLDSENRAQTRYSVASGLQRVDRAVGDAVHPDRAVAPWLCLGPGNNLCGVPLFDIIEHAPVAAGCPGAADINHRLHVSAADQCVVDSERGEAAARKRARQFREFEQAGILGWRVRHRDTEASQPAQQPGGQVGDRLVVWGEVQQHRQPLGHRGAVGIGRPEHLSLEDGAV
ncbi:Uncharacterised protein [Mycobacteroides abscessus subsp. abscessus]|nr:Uncharacterised protein [Mycobacteroides abscessus subsp. abscessus]SIC56707.1 Uncharacterised protein [Mycobacteroides abscessus subsp. abscessus]SIE54388.1 Uncharacterised protein [Mycobacteroides abscessus subsp. abscessus]SIH90186.1 Uncharacterised protein [Mycobacteroides abscessus subsp. abscessus]SKQ58344.1 Uncharacterised protein [Mycobacteroides abscessus subsp. abscessus]